MQALNSLARTQLELDKQVCDGRNVSMDYCGTNGAIPSSAVCFPGGPAASGGRWNASCTGCDGVPRPDLQWFPAAANINKGLGLGGLRVDACGVCGGSGKQATAPSLWGRKFTCRANMAEMLIVFKMLWPLVWIGWKEYSVCTDVTLFAAGTSCAGCDGVPNSRMKTDICGVCGGDGFSCRGCDGISQAVAPNRRDSCGVCGGGTFGVCGCDYKAINNATKCAPGCDGVPSSGLKVWPLICIKDSLCWEWCTGCRWNCFFSLYCMWPHHFWFNCEGRPTNAVFVAAMEALVQGEDFMTPLEDAI